MPDTAKRGKAVKFPVNARAAMCPHSCISADIKVRTATYGVLKPMRTKAQNRKERQLIMKFKKTFTRPRSINPPKKSVLPPLCDRTQKLLKYIADAPIIYYSVARFFLNLCLIETPATEERWKIVLFSSTISEPSVVSTFSILPTLCFPFAVYLIFPFLWINLVL